MTKILKNVTVYINGKPEKVDIRIYPGGKKASDRKWKSMRQAYYICSCS